MLDGAVLCFLCFLVWCALRSRRDLRWSLGIGIGFGLIFLTKGILAILLVAIALIFLAWDTPRLLRSGYLWAGLMLGSAPVIAWYVAQWQHYGIQAGENLLHHSLRRIWDRVESNGGPPWYYGLELLKYGWPWLIFLPEGLYRAWTQRNLGWAKLILVWAGVYFTAISLMGTKLPWYGLPLYPAIALAVGWQCDRSWQEFPGFSYPRYWIGLIGLMAVVGWAGSVYFSPFGLDPSPILQLVAIAVGLTMTVTALLMLLSDRQWLPVLLWGSYLSLLIFVCSNSWIWELSEAYPVKPVAAILRQQVPAAQIVYTSYPDTRPSLDFYSQHQVESTDLETLQGLWQESPTPYFLIRPSDLETLALQNVAYLGQAEGWQLVTRTTVPGTSVSAWRSSTL